MISLRSVFDPPNIILQIKDLKKQQEADDFWQDQKKVSLVGKKIRSLEKKLEEVENLEKKFDDCNAIIELFEETLDASLEKEVEKDINSFEKQLEVIRLQTLLKGKYDDKNAILTIHAGAGGTEAQDWAEMLYRMYSMYAERVGFKHNVLDVVEGDEAGLKSITFMVEGENAYGYLKAEKGVHRLVRISPFDANARRHTSFASVEAIPEIEEAPDIKIKPEDLRVDTYRSSGAGGQHVNKTDSAVRLTHLPTGFVVACQNERSQTQNKETAMKMLISKLAQKQEQDELEKIASIRGELKKNEWGSQIRSYVFHPYNMVKDHRTGWETSNISLVMDGDLQDFINEYLKKA